MSKIESPCRNICKLDPAGLVCSGCHRSLDEITRWRTMSAAERTAIIARLPKIEA